MQNTFKNSYRLAEYAGYKTREQRHRTKCLCGNRTRFIARKFSEVFNTDDDACFNKFSDVLIPLEEPDDHAIYSIEPSSDPSKFEDELKVLQGFRGKIITVIEGGLVKGIISKQFCPFTDQSLSDVNWSIIGDNKSAPEDYKSLLDKFRTVIGQYKRSETPISAESVPENFIY